MTATNLFSDLKFHPINDERLSQMLQRGITLREAFARPENGYIVKACYRQDTGDLLSIGAIEAEHVENPVPQD